MRPKVRFEAANSEFFTGPERPLGTDRKPTSTSLNTIKIEARRERWVKASKK